MSELDPGRIVVMVVFVSLMVAGVAIAWQTLGTKTFLLVVFWWAGVIIGLMGHRLLTGWPSVLALVGALIAAYKVFSALREPAEPQP